MLGWFSIKAHKLFYMFDLDVKWFNNRETLVTNLGVVSNERWGRLYVCGLLFDEKFCILYLFSAYGLVDYRI